MPIVDTKGWNEWETKNEDAYGKACVDVAREVMTILDKEPGEIDTHGIICRADKVAGAGGITGFMAGCVAQMVSQCHSRGDEFRRRWNKDNGIEDERDGVVNPAIIEIG